MNCEIGQGKYFVYRHIRLDKNIPFYIGVGTKTSYTNTFNETHRRAFVKFGKNLIWKRIVAKSDYRIEIILESNDYEYILRKETEFIKLYGRKDLNTGSLANLTDGGIGNKNMPKRRCSDETKLKMSDSSKGIPKSNQHKKALSDAKLKNPVRYWQDKTFSEEHKMKLRKPKKRKIYEESN